MFLIYENIRKMLSMIQCSPGWKDVHVETNEIESGHISESLHC